MNIDTPLLFRRHSRAASPIASEAQLPRKERERLTGTLRLRHGAEGIDAGRRPKGAGR